MGQGSIAQSENAFLPVYTRGVQRGIRFCLTWLTLLLKVNARRTKAAGYAGFLERSLKQGCTLARYN